MLLFRMLCKATLVLLLFGNFLTLSAQHNPPFGKTEDDVIMEKSVLLQEVDTTQGYFFRSGKGAPSFPNINRRARYHDKKKLAALRKLERGEDIFEYGLALSQYVRQFGVQNFRDSSGVSMLWKLGRTRQIMQDTAAAVFYYELAIKHTRNWGAPRLAYDSLTAATRSDWLSIDTYYQLLELRQRIDPLIPPKSVLTNMGRAINSEDADYAPYMHPSDSVLIFTSRRGQNDVIDPFMGENEELYYSVKNFITGKWEDAAKFSDAINSRFNEGSACLDPDGKTLYFTRCNSDDEGHLGDCDIYQATYDAGDWVDVKNLGVFVNSGSWDSQPNISADGSLLFFSSNRRGGFGGIDIYFCTRNEGGGWSKAQNVGPVINTSQDELSPFFHMINRTLYFGSNGQLKNYGGFDIFKTRWMDNQWEEPKNVGPLVNSTVNEYYFSIDSDGENIFYASSKRGELAFEFQDFDLFSFPMPMESRPDATTKLRGVLLDSITGHPLVGSVMVVDLDNGIEIAPKQINTRGFFEFDLKNNNRYRIYVIGDNFLTIRNDLVLYGDTTFDVITQSIEQNKPLVFESLEFGSNSYKLSGYVKPKLDYIAKFLTNYPMYRVVVEGHTDGDGEAAYNLDLSLQRAQQIQAYIEKEGKFPPGRVLAQGYGETRPLVPNDTEENKRKNRRVEFRLIWDPAYKGKKFLPMKEELNFEEEFLDDDDYDPEEFLREFDLLDLLETDGDSTETDDWDLESFEDDLDDELDAEMEKFLMEDEKKKPVKTKPDDDDG